MRRRGARGRGAPSRRRRGRRAPRKSDPGDRDADGDGHADDDGGGDRQRLPASGKGRGDAGGAPRRGRDERLRGAPALRLAGARLYVRRPVEGEPIAYWQELERTTDERPLETLAELLRLPYVLSRGIYVWPWTYTVERAADLSAHERELLAPLGSPGELFAPGTGYLGWRTGISPDGTWTFFVAGD